MTVRWTPLLLLPLLAGVARADGKSDPPVKVDRSMVVMDLAAQSPEDAPRAQAVTALLTAQGLHVALRRDLAGRPRCVIATP